MRCCFAIHIIYLTKRKQNNICDMNFQKLVQSCIRNKHISRPEADTYGRMPFACIKNINRLL